jgi:hypothetical protein
VTWAVPEIPWAISLDTAQELLTPEQVTALNGINVTEIDKDEGLGLQWYDAPPEFRSPGYSSLEFFIAIALSVGCTRAIPDKRFLRHMEETEVGSGAHFGNTLVQSSGLKMSVYTIQTNEEWIFLESIGVDAIYSDIIEDSIAHEMRDERQTAEPTTTSSGAGLPNRSKDVYVIMFLSFVASFLF